MTSESWEGQTVAGKYRVEKILGKGGMGVVVSARHLALDEPVAIKILRPAMMEVPGMVARFVREARAASRIRSDHVVRVTDVDTLESGVPYLVMEHLDGDDLAALRKQRGSFTVRAAVRYVLEACDALAEAHSLGIVHRDIKPSNLFLEQRRDGTERVKVLDFGISKVEDAGEQDTTKTGQMMGSPKYMAPEQMLSMHRVDGRADIWSLGAVLYELLAGRPPFTGDTTPQICALVLNSDPIPPSRYRPGLPRELEAIILRCLEKKPEKRFAEVAELIRALLPIEASAPEDEVVPAVAPEEDPGATAPIRLLDPTPPAPSGSAPDAISAPLAQPVSVTESAWHAPPIAAPSRRSRAPRAIAASAALLLVGLAAGVLLTRGGASPAVVTATADSQVAVPREPPVGAPEVTPSAAAIVLDASAPEAAQAPKSYPVSRPVAPRKLTEPPRPARPVDPFGGRRN